MLPYFKNIKGLHVYAFFVLIIAYQVFFTFQGLDMMDEGFHVVLYQQIFNDPASVQYGLVYWLTVITGGLLMKLTAPLGLWGIRLGGVLITTLTVALAYRACKKYIPKSTLQVGLFFVLLLLNADPKNFYYNNLSSFLYLLAAVLLFKGLTRNKWIYLATAGFVTALNIFTRIPNILGLGMFTLIVFFGFAEKEGWSRIIKKSSIYFSGAISGVLLVLSLMYLFGHLHLFIDAVKILFPNSNLKKEMVIEEGGYKVDNLLFILIKQYYEVFYYVVISFATLFIFLFVKEHLKNKSEIIKRVGNGILYSILFLMIYRFIKSDISGIYQYKLINLFMGTSVLCALLVIAGKYSSDVKLIVLLGLFILIVQPLGSFLGIYFVAPYSLWLIFPFVINGLAHIEELKFNANVKIFDRLYTIDFKAGNDELRHIKSLLACVYIFSIGYRLVTCPYVEDMHSRKNMRFRIDNIHMKHIYTSYGRAGSINELLNESSKYIKKNDRVLAYEMIPMYHYLTETKPYLGNPCPWYYTSSVFASKMEEADKSYGPPFMVIQKISTMGEGNSWPEILPKEDFTELKRNEGRYKILQEYLNKHHYVKVWENNVFKIMKPEQ